MFVKGLSQEIAFVIVGSNDDSFGTVNERGMLSGCELRAVGKTIYGAIAGSEYGKEAIGLGFTDSPFDKRLMLNLR